MTGRANRMTSADSRVASRALLYIVNQEESPEEAIAHALADYADLGPVQLDLVESCIRATITPPPRAES